MDFYCWELFTPLSELSDVHIWSITYWLARMNLFDRCSVYSLSWLSDKENLQRTSKHRWLHWQIRIVIPVTHLGATLRWSSPQLSQGEGRLAPCTSHQLRVLCIQPQRWGCVSLFCSDEGSVCATLACFGRASAFLRSVPWWFVNHLNQLVLRRHDQPVWLYKTDRHL